MSFDFRHAARMTTPAQVGHFRNMDCFEELHMIEFAEAIWDIPAQTIRKMRNKWIMVAAAMFVTVLSRP